MGETGGKRKEERRERRQTIAHEVDCTLIHVLGKLSWPFDEMLQRRMVMIFKLQIIWPHTLARCGGGRALRVAYSGFSQAVKSKAFLEEVR